MAAVRALAAEENNLADALRSAVAVPDPAATADLTSALASFWTIRGENTRVIAVAAAVDAAFEGWEPPPEEIDAALTAAAVTALNTVLGEIAATPNCLRLLAAYGDRATDPRAAAMVVRAGRPGPGATRRGRWSGCARSTCRVGTTGRPRRPRGSGRRTTSRTWATPRARSSRPRPGSPRSTTTTDHGSGR